jgi:hypothetical protein
MMKDPSDDRVSPRTRAFELEDEQVFAGAGRRPTPDEAAQAELNEPVAASVVDSYREKLERGSHQQGEGRPGW